MAKRKSKNPEANMNEEWIDLYEGHEGHESPLFWVDLDAESQLAVVQEKLILLEQKAAKLVEKPRALLSHVRRKMADHGIKRFISK